MAPKAAGEGEEKDVGFRVDGGVERQLKPGERSMVDIGADLSFGVLVEAIDGLPCHMNGGPDIVVPLF